MQTGLLPNLFVQSMPKALNDPLKRGPVQGPAATETSLEALFQFVQYVHLKFPLILGQNALQLLRSPYPQLCHKYSKAGEVDNGKER